MIRCAKEPRRANLGRAEAGLLLLLAAASVHATDVPQIQGHLGSDNPFMAPGGAGAMHGDAYASDATPMPGLGTDPVSVINGPTLSGPTDPYAGLAGRPCGTILIGSDGLVVAFCFGTGSGGNLVLYDPETLVPLTRIATPPTGALGLYMYLDEQNRAVIGGGDRHIRRISHAYDGSQWAFSVEDDWDLSSSIPNVNACTRPSTDPTCDYIVSVGPDWDGNIWFSSNKGVVGVLDPDTGDVHSLTIGGGEVVANGMANSPEGTAIVTTHALYLFDTDDGGAPELLWREEYDRGTAVKPGQLTQGSGATPTFFGPNGDKYLAITDNADVQENLLVYKVRRTNPKLLCTTPIFSPGASGTEASPVGIGQSVFVTNMYGYVTRANTPESDTNAGGLQRIDINGDDCDVVWTNPIKLTAMVKMSAADGNLYTVARSTTSASGTPAWSYDWTVIDAASGETLSQTNIGSAFTNDAFFLAGNIDPFTGDFYQGTLGGIQRFYGP